MKIELNSKLLQAVSGLFLLAIAIVWMACGPFELYAFSWLPGLFLLLGALSLAGASYLGKMDGRLATKAVFYLLYAILFFTVDVLIVNVYFVALWAMIEGAWLAQGGAIMRKNGEISGSGSVSDWINRVKGLLHRSCGTGDATPKSAAGKKKEGRG